MIQAARRRNPWLAAGVLLAAALLVIPAAMGAGPAYPFKAKTSGFKTKDWAVQWWQWAYGIPEGYSPLIDDTGEYAAIGQRGPVWFLVGAYTIDGVESRTITIPEGKSLFFPILARQFDNVGAVTPKSVEDLQADAAAFAMAVDLLTLSCSVDGIALTDLPKRRVISGPFEYTVGPGTLPVGFGAEAGDVVYPAVSDGYWVMLKPLAPGNHVVEFSGAVGGDFDYVQDVTYNITVVATASAE
jgi:hypothetical protein